MGTVRRGDRYLWLKKHPSARRIGKEMADVILNNVTFIFAVYFYNGIGKCYSTISHIHH